MVTMVKLKYVDNLSGGRKRFRKRYSKAVAQVLGEEYFQVPMKARSGSALVLEQEALLEEFEKIVTKAKRKAAGRGTLSPREHWLEAIKEAEAMKAAVIGAVDEDEAQTILADDLHSRGADPVLLKAIMQPDAEAPSVTMLDAKEMYRNERMGGATGRNQQNRLDRVCRRVEEALGPLHMLPLVEFKREHGRKLRDFMLAQRKSDGSPLSPLSVRRELDMVRAMVSLAIVEFDLKGKAHNPFDGLDLPKNDIPTDNEWERRDPLPKDVILEMRKRMRGNLREPALGLIWRMLEGTGCRGAEVVGLRVEDVHVDGPNPHIWVRWHEERRVKTKVSIRAVPLVGDALVAAKDALWLAKGEKCCSPATPMRAALTRSHRPS